MTRAIRMTSTVVVLILAAAGAASERQRAFGAAGATKPPTFPDTAAGRAIRELLTAFNAGDPEALRVDNYDILLHMGSSAGGGYSTVMGLLRFAMALEDGTLVSRETAGLFMTGQVPVPFAEGARYGGGFPGVRSKLDIYRDLGYNVVVLSNVDGGAQPVIAKVRDLLVRGEATPMRRGRSGGKGRPSEPAALPSLVSADMVARIDVPAVFLHRAA